MLSRGGGGVGPGLDDCMLVVSGVDGSIWISYLDCLKRYCPREGRDGAVDSVA